MKGGEFIREARKRAGLTQRELAELMLTTQAVIARWETGQRSPAFERVAQAVRACGLDLSVRVVARDDDHDAAIDRNLKLTPGDRLARFEKARRGVDELRRNAKIKS